MNSQFLAKIFQEPSQFAKEDLRAGKILFEKKKVMHVLFSEGTYQIEVKDDKAEEPYWPFIQIDDHGEILDAFCSCEASEKTGSCPHLAAAYYRIYNQLDLPLHVRFHQSFWNRLCQILSRECGYDVAILKGNLTKGYEVVAQQSKEKRFFFRPLTQAAHDRLHEMIHERTLETEETSLKFSNLSAEELKNWREKRPSIQLRYELSFWSDFAKYLLFLQDMKALYQIIFDEEGEELPKSVRITFDQIEIGFPIRDHHYEEIIPSLNTVNASLALFELPKKRIEQITYDAKECAFHIQTTAIPGMEKEKEIAIGAWIYVPRFGFYQQEIDPLLKRAYIDCDHVDLFLTNHLEIILKYLRSIPIFASAHPIRYHLYFDQKDALHIESYLFERNDFKNPDSRLFKTWAYLHGQGFYFVSHVIFDQSMLKIEKAQLPGFIKSHREWLQEREGFQVHQTSLSAKLNYVVGEDRKLRFFVEMGVDVKPGEVIDLGKYFFIKSSGFYPKTIGKNDSPIRDGQVVPPEEISSFIEKNREELETITGFFAEHSPIQKIGVYIKLDDEHNIFVSPQFCYLPEYDYVPKSVCGDFVYVKGKGFSQISKKFQIPVSYSEEKTISPKNQNHFLAYELDILQPFILGIDRRLKKPKEIFLRVNRFKKDPKAKTHKWIVSLDYVSDLGTTSAYDAFVAIQEQNDFLFSMAGLIFLKTARFSWLKKIPKKRWMPKSNSVRLSTMEWIKLCIFEDIKEPTGSSREEIATRKALEDYQLMNDVESIDLSGFNSNLRSYQEIGLKWLWFLYCQDLSGLLCDEMGLGKTHQAMALLAAISNFNESNSLPFKAVVVCPTSVIYHWEELFKRFFPKMKVTIFYGMQRTLEDFHATSGLLLTSYGLLRREHKTLKATKFDIAIFDEVQIAKNAESQTHKALRDINAKMRLGLTGTPIENNLFELKALFDLILPGYMPVKSTFKAMFVQPIEKFQDQESIQLLNKLIHPFILRRKKTEVLLELPEKTEEIAYSVLSDEQRALYQKMIQDSKMMIVQELENEKKPIPYIHIFALLSKLKQICNHPCMITKKYDDYDKSESGKWELFKQLLQESRDSKLKVVVFSQYLEMLNMIEKYLTDQKIQFAGIRGSTRDRKEELTRFREDPQCEVFVASLQAAGVGIDLVAASVVIHYDRWWNPAKENQATDRVHRIGQSRGVQVFKMVTKGTIEEHIYQLIEKKKGLVEEVIGYDDQDQIKKLDRQDLLELLKMTDLDSELK